MRIKEIAKEIHAINVSKGFWDNKGSKNVGEMLMLTTSELSEALEAHRDGDIHKPMIDYELDMNNPDDSSFYEKNYKNCFETEIADAIIRLLDISEGLNFDIETYMRLKINYNKTRPHKHGRAY